MQVFKTFGEGCTFFDVVLQCYASLNLMPKFIQDNNIIDLNLITFAGQSFLFDTDLVSDEFLMNDVIRNDYKFTTGKLSTNVVRGNYLLAENLEILATEQNNLFII